MKKKFSCFNKSNNIVHRKKIGTLNVCCFRVYIIVYSVSSLYYDSHIKIWMILVNDKWKLETHWLYVRKTVSCDSLTFCSVWKRKTYIDLVCWCLFIKFRLLNCYFDLLYFSFLSLFRFVGQNLLLLYELLSLLVFFLLLLMYLTVRQSYSAFYSCSPIIIWIDTLKNINTEKREI